VVADISEGAEGAEGVEGVAAVGIIMVGIIVVDAEGGNLGVVLRTLRALGALGEVVGTITIKTALAGRPPPRLFPLLELRLRALRALTARHYPPPTTLVW
jgi:uncharacterized RDD family membrane protein YckC